MACLVMTLEEMLKIALGTTTPDHVNLAVLHSFLRILIYKLDIKSHFVEISGPEVCELRQMLCQSHNPIVEFKTCEDMHEGETCFASAKVTNMEDHIHELMDVVVKMEHDLKSHLDATERCKDAVPACSVQLKKKKKHAEDDGFSSECEDLCDPCDEQNLIACSLLQNTGFLKKLMRKISTPVINRIFEFEKMIQILNEKFQNFLNLAEDEYKKIPLIEECLAKLATLEKEFHWHKIEFIRTMEEVQQMLDAKLDKVTIPAFKKYIMDRLDEVEKKLDDMLQKEACPKAAGVIMQNVQCLCCTTRVCQKDRIFPVPLMATVSGMDKIKHAKGKLPKLCIPTDRERACGGSHTIIHPSERSMRTSNLIDEFGDKKKLRIGHENVEYFKGTDGGMYRLAPDDNAPCKGHL